MTQSGHGPLTETERLLLKFSAAHLSETQSDADSVKVLVMDEARRVASNIVNCRTAAAKAARGNRPLVHARLVIDYHRTLICHHETRSSVRQRRC